MLTQRQYFTDDKWSDMILYLMFVFIGYLYSVVVWVVAASTG